MKHLKLTYELNGVKLPGYMMYEAEVILVHHVDSKGDVSFTQLDGETLSSVRKDRFTPLPNEPLLTQKHTGYVHINGAWVKLEDEARDDFYERFIGKKVIQHNHCKTGVKIHNYEDRMQLVKILAAAGYCVKIEERKEHSHSIDREYIVFYWSETEVES